MKTKVLIFTVILSLGMVFQDCEKEEAKPIQTSTNYENSNLNKKNYEFKDKVAPWVISAVAYVVVKVVGEISEGQYSSTTTTHPNGSTTTVTQCSGIGKCAISGSISVDNGVGGGQPLSNESSVSNFDSSYLFNGEFIRLNDDRIIFTIKPTEEGYSKFFNSTTISLSKPFIINNETFINEIGLEDGENLILSGNYEVETDAEGQKFIVVY